MFLAGIGHLRTIVCIPHSGRLGLEISNCSLSLSPSSMDNSYRIPVLSLSVPRHPCHCTSEDDLAIRHPAHSYPSFIPTLEMGTYHVLVRYGPCRVGSLPRRPRLQLFRRNKTRPLQTVSDCLLELHQRARALPYVLS